MPLFGRIAVLRHCIRRLAVDCQPRKNAWQRGDTAHQSYGHVAVKYKCFIETQTDTALYNILCKSTLQSTVHK
jgi:hypothetical protein